MKPVTVYSTNYCGYCQRAKEFLKKESVPFQEVDVTGDDAAREQLVERSGGQRTVPQIFVGDTHVGGYSDMMALHLAGKLRPLLDS